MKWVLVIGLVVTGLASWRMWHVHQKIRSGHVVPGQVTRLIPVRGSKGGVSFKLQVAYTLPTGDQKTFNTSSSSKPPTHDLGERIPVVIYPDRSEPDILAFWDLYFIPVIFLTFGVALLLVYLSGIFGPRLVNYLYISGPSPIPLETPRL